MPARKQVRNRETRSLSPVFWLVLVALAVGSVFALRHWRTQAKGNLPTAPVRQGDFAVIVRCRGTAGARRSVQLAAPRNIPDLKIVWQAEPGSVVKAGQAIVRFDSSGAQRQLDENAATLRQLQATLEQAQAQARITREQDKLDLANARYQVERARLEASKQAIVSAIQGAESKIDLTSAEEALRVQEAAMNLHGKSSEARLASLERERDEAQTDFDLIKQRLAQMTMKAPIDGLISYSLNYSQGWVNAQPFKSGDQVWPGAIVAEIPDPATLQMEGKLDEVDRGRIALGDEVRVRLDALPEQVFPAKLGSVSLLTEMSFEWPPVRNFMAYAPLAKPDPKLRTGMNGSMDIVIRQIPGALSVPAKAVFTRNGKPVVYVSEPKRYRAVEIEVLARNPDEVAVKGVAAGAAVTLAEPSEKELGGESR